MSRRSLLTCKLKPPEYSINPQVLIESFVEKEIRFGGIITNVPMHIDSTNRTGILRLIDKGKLQGIISDCKKTDDDAVFIVNAFKLKVTRRDGEEVLLQVPIHEVAAVCYIEEDGEHILVLKVGDSSAGGGVSTSTATTRCQLVVLLCPTKSAAEELCALMSQCFQLVYVEAIMHFFDTQLRDGAQFEPGSEQSTYSRQESLGNKPSFMTGSQQSLDQSSPPGGQPRQGQRKASVTCSESEMSGSANELIHEYFWTLHTKLNASELKQFALLLSRWHSDLPFLEFCQKVAELFGPERKYLLRGMRPFIPEKDYDTFESFLLQSGISSSDTSSVGGTSLPTSHTPGQYRRQVSGASLAASTSLALPDEHDQMLASISSRISRLGQDDSPT